MPTNPVGSVDGTRLRYPVTLGWNNRSAAATPRHARSISPLCDRSWAAVQQYLDGNLGGAIRLHDMARAACASPFHFARKFRARTGMSPMEYVMEKRIAKAKEALACGGCTICSIAQDLGFHDQSHFCRSFSRCIGMTPSNFRRSASESTSAAD